MTYILTPLLIAMTFSACSDKNCIYDNPTGPLISGETDPNELVSNPPSEEKELGPSENELIIIQAIQNDDIGALITFFEENSSLINQPLPSEDGLTPLMLSAKWGRLDMIVELITMGADQDKATENGLTAAYYARESGFSLLARYLDASLSQQDLNEALFTNAAGDGDEIESYVKLGADPNFVEEKAGNVLMQAISSQRLENVRRLLALGADPSKKVSVRGRSVDALDYAKLTRANPEIIQLLENSLTN